MLLLKLSRSTHLSYPLGCRTRFLSSLNEIHRTTTRTICTSNSAVPDYSCAQCSSSNQSFRKQQLQPSRHFHYDPIDDKMIKKSKWLKELGKFRLTFFVSGTAAAGYAAAPVNPDAFSYLSTWLSLSTPSFAATSLTFTCMFMGTFLCSMSANTFNHMFEPSYDAQGKKGSRPVPRGIVSPQKARETGISLGAVGTGILALGANLPTALLGFSNIILYSLIYTSSKRTTIWNTWIGAVVGAIPPMMGWVAVTGLSGMLNPEAWILPLFVYCWQFPHFNAISWLARSAYGRAGYPMMSVIDPDLARNVARRHALAQVLLTPFICYCFAPSSWIFSIMLGFNYYLYHCTKKFYNFPTEFAKKLMLASFLNIFIVVVLVLGWQFKEYVDKQIIVAHHL